MPSMLRRFLFIALIVFLCVIAAFAAGMGVYGFSKGHTNPVPGRLVPSTSIGK